MNVKVTIAKIRGMRDIYRGIIIDPRQSDRSMLETTIHEAAHEAFPGMLEKEVDDAAKLIAAVVWTVGYRRKKKK